MKKQLKELSDEAYAKEKEEAEKNDERLEEYRQRQIVRFNKRLDTLKERHQMFYKIAQLLCKEDTVIPQDLLGLK